MSPREFIDFAQRLVASPTSVAAELHSAISRAYYGTYLSVRAFLQEELHTPCRSGGISEHQKVQRYLINSQVAEAVELGHMLGTLLQARKLADYEIDDASSEVLQIAVLNVERAGRILDRLRECSLPPLQAKLQAGIIHYRRTIKEL